MGSDSGMHLFYCGYKRDTHATNSFCFTQHISAAATFGIQSNIYALAIHQNLNKKDMVKCFRSCVIKVKIALCVLSVYYIHSYTYV